MYIYISIYSCQDIHSFWSDTPWCSTSIVQAIKKRKFKGGGGKMGNESKVFFLFKTLWYKIDLGMLLVNNQERKGFILCGDGWFSLPFLFLEREAIGFTSTINFLVLFWTWKKLKVQKKDMAWQPSEDAKTTLELTIKRWFVFLSHSVSYKENF